MTSRPWGWLVALFCCTCASPQPRPEPEVATIRHVDKVAPGAATTVPLAGARCQGGTASGTGSCACRLPGDDAETEPPAEGMKRLEIRLSADGGRAALEGGLGHFQVAGPQERCFYVDVRGGQTSDVSFKAHADRPLDGVAPRLTMAEYGAKGNHWYAIIDVECRGERGRCDKQGADAWGARNLRDRKRGRLDPCGSAVVKQLSWDSAGGEPDREGGFFRELTVRFALEVKKFATQFAPGSTECVPK
jgi:hypothetical protein